VKFSFLGETSYKGRERERQRGCDLHRRQAMNDRALLHRAEVEGGTIFVAWGKLWKEALPTQVAAIRALMPNMAGHTGQGSMHGTNIINLGEHGGYKLQCIDGDYCIVGTKGNARKIFVMPSTDKRAPLDGFFALIHTL